MAGESVVTYTTMIRDLPTGERAQGTAEGTWSELPKQL